MSDKAWVVEAILTHKFDAETGEPVYWTKWHGYPSSENTWEPASSFKGGGTLLHDYVSRMATTDAKSAHPIASASVSAQVPVSLLDSLPCIVCSGLQDEHLTLLCDQCSDAYHIYCLKPKLHAVWVHQPPCCLRVLFLPPYLFPTMCTDSRACERMFLLLFMHRSTSAISVAGA